MYIKRAAELIGINAKALRDFIRKNPGLVSPVGGGRTYNLTLEEVEVLKEAYWDSRKRVPKEQPMRGTDDAGLPLEALGNPSMRDEFHRLRVERNRRLDTLLREAGMSLGAMPDKLLVQNGRALDMEVSA